jgi:hypothetical protein
MKKVTKEIAIPSYPFSDNDFTYHCRCKDPVLLRKSSLLDKTFVVSEAGDHIEIIHQTHRCTKTRQHIRGKK